MNELEEFRLRWRGRETGPFTLDEINRQLDDHKIGLSHEIFHDGEWVQLETFLAPPVSVPAIIPPPPPVVINVPSPKVVGVNTRRRLVFGLFAVFGGFAGLHNFYARQWLTGMLQILLSVISILMGFGVLPSWIWAAIEAFTVHRDANGVEMT